MSDTRRHIYEFGPFRVDAVKRLLLRGGEPARLPTKAFDMLLVLLEEQGRVVSKDELMRRVWPDAVVEENNLTVNMSALRKALGESPQEHRYLLTVPGRGYQFVAGVRQDAGESARETAEKVPVNQRTTAAEVVPEPGDVDGEAKHLPPGGADSGSVEVRQHRRGVLLVLAALLATTGVAAYFASSRRLAGSGKAGVSSIAVLPFANKSDDPNAEYLSDGISESLTNSLSQLPGLKVIAISSSFKYKGQEVDVQEAARALGVEAILTGSVSQRGDGLVIGAELVRASDETQMWGEQYDRRMSDLLAAQREIAREIVEKLRPKVSGEEERFPKHYTESNEAYRLYLKGRFHWNKRTEEGLRKSVEHFNQAIEKDPGFALAYAGLADCYVVPANRLPPREAMPKARAAAERALELDETLAEAHASLARVLAAYDGNWAGAEKEYRRAIELNPRYAIARQWHGGYLEATGRHTEAIAERKLTLELEPLSLIINFEMGLAYYYARDYDRAIRQFHNTLELDESFRPARVFLPAAYEQKGMYGEAIAEFKNAIPLKGGEQSLAKAGLGHAYAVSGKKSEARTMIAELKQLSEQEYVPSSSVALIYAGLGEKDQAFAWLDKGYEERAFQMQWIKIEPRLDGLRSDPRFQDLMRRVGLPQ